MKHWKIISFISNETSCLIVTEFFKKIQTKFFLFLCRVIFSKNDNKTVYYIVINLFLMRRGIIFKYKRWFPATFLSSNTTANNFNSFFTLIKSKSYSTKYLLSYPVIIISLELSFVKIIWINFLIIPKFQIQFVFSS